MQPIRKWMKTEVVTVKPLDSIAHARKLMLEKRFNQLPVVHHGRLAGIITDRDLRDAYPSVFEEARHDMTGKHDDWSPERVKVESVMTAEVRTIPVDSSVADAARLMRAERIGALPVVEGRDRLVGLITRSDVLEAYVDLDEGPST